MKNVTWSTFISALLVVLLAACSTGGGTGDTNNGSGDSGGDTPLSGIAATAAFPRTLAITSPAATATSSSASLRVQQQANRVLTYDEIVSTIDVILDVQSDFDLAQDFNPDLLFRQAGNANCYGPAVVVGEHPDWSDREPNEKGELPTGDLGLWDEREGSTQEACAAAQLNARIAGVQSRVFGAMAFTGVLLRVADDAGIDKPAVGGEADITDAFNDALDASSIVGAPTVVSAKYTQEDANTASYVLEFTTGSESRNVIELTHREESEDVYQGFLYYRTDGGDSANNCEPGEGLTIDSTNNGTLLYNVSGTEVTFESRFAGYCGANVVPDGNGTTRATSLLDPANFSREDNPNGWGGNFEVFGAEFDSETLVGSYVYAWQAGPNDGFARTLLADIVSAGDGQVGTAYFGYAGDMTEYEDATAASLTNDFRLRGMFCNWTTPRSAVSRGDDISPQDLRVAQPSLFRRDIRLGVQEQVMTRSGLDEVFVVSSSNIEYAPIKPRGPDGELIEEMDSPALARCTAPTGDGKVLELFTKPPGSAPGTDGDGYTPVAVSKTDELIALDVYLSATESWTVTAPSNPFDTE